MEILKIKEKKRSWDKQLNFLEENNNNPQLFILFYIKIAWKFTIIKEQKIDIKT